MNAGCMMLWSEELRTNLGILVMMHLYMPRSISPVPTQQTLILAITAIRPGDATKKRT